MLQIANSTDGNVLVPISVIGYDIYDNSFVNSKLEIERKYDFKTKKNILIRINSDEKLLRFYKEDKLVKNVPISSIENRVDISDLKPGNYLIEAVNLADRMMRYCAFVK